MKLIDSHFSPITSAVADRMSLVKKAHSFEKAYGVCEEGEEGVYSTIKSDSRIYFSHHIVITFVW